MIINYYIIVLLILQQIGSVVPLPQSGNPSPRVFRLQKQGMSDNHDTMN